MKQSELKQLIREEIQKVLKESTYDDPIKKRAEQAYKNQGPVSITGLGNAFRKYETIPVGKYTVEENDEDGWSDPRFNIVISEPMKPFDLAVQLAQETGWISPWSYLQIKAGHDDEVEGKVLTFPREKTLFDLD